MNPIKEKNKTLFIYSLKEIVKREPVMNLPFFLRFIAKNIRSSSGKVRVAVINMSRWVVDYLPQPLNEKEEKMICRFIDRLIDMMEEYYEEEFCKCKYIGDLPPSVYKSLQTLISRVLLSEDYYRKAYEKHLKKIPASMDCTWKRVPCGKDNCPVCAVGDSLRIKETSVVKETLIYKQAKEWCEDVFMITEEAEDSGEFWMFTRAASDLFWYSNVLLIKCSVLAQSKPLSFKNNYAHYVVRESLKIIKRSIKEIISADASRKDDLDLILLGAKKIEKNIFKL